MKNTSVSNSLMATPTEARPVAARTSALSNLAVVLLSVAFALPALAQQEAAFATRLLENANAPIPAVHDGLRGRLFVAKGGQVSYADLSKPESASDFRVWHRSRANRVLRLRIDAPRDRLWVLDVGAVLVYDLKSHRLLRRIVLSNWPYASNSTYCEPDLQVDASGRAFVSNAIVPKLWRIDPDFSLTEHDVRLGTEQKIDAGFSGLSAPRNGTMLATVAAPGTLWRLDTRTFQAEKIALAAPVFGGCSVETIRMTSEREFGVVVLAASRNDFELVRIDAAPVNAEASVQRLLPAVARPAGLLELQGALNLVVAHRAREALSGNSTRHAEGLELRPVRAFD